MARICVVGSWHLASVSSVGLADLGHQVWGVHDERNAIGGLAAGKPPIFEPKLERLLRRNLKNGRLRYTVDYERAVRGAAFVMIALDTTVRDDDSPDLGTFWQAVHAVTGSLSRSAILVINSQVPVGVSEELMAYIRKKRPRLAFDVAYNPEFLRLGNAVEIFRRPDRIVIGGGNQRTIQRVAGLYAKLRRPIVQTDLRTAEMAKHASNSFLATSISFINEMARICDAVGADVKVVAQAMRLDERIGPDAYLNPGLGFSGGTLGRDIRALQELGRAHGRETPLVDAVLRVNERQQAWALERLGALLGDVKERRIGILGLTYKAGTDTLRRSPALDTIRKLQAGGAEIVAYDPLVRQQNLTSVPAVQFNSDIYQAAAGCDALVLFTGGAEVSHWDFARLAATVRRKMFLDCQHAINPGSLLRHGFVYAAPGRGTCSPSDARK